jgi:large subunit ribosomal protein L17
MQHRKKGRKLGRRPDHRNSMLRNLSVSLIESERIETTVTRAKEVRRVVERLVTYAKRGDLHGRRLVLAALGNNQDAATKLVDDIAPRYGKRDGGYTRVLKTGFRRGDAAPTALIEFVEEALPKKRKRAATKAAPKKAAVKPAEDVAEETPEAAPEAAAEAPEAVAAEATTPEVEAPGPEAAAESPGEEQSNS